MMTHPDTKPAALAGRDAEVEAVARAIFDARVKGSHKETVTSWETTTEFFRDLYREDARAALSALSAREDAGEAVVVPCEPTETMLDAALDCWETHDPGDKSHPYPRSIWASMVAAAPRYERPVGVAEPKGWTEKICRLCGDRTVASPSPPKEAAQDMVSVPRDVLREISQITAQGDNADDVYTIEFVARRANEALAVAPLIEAQARAEIEVLTAANYRQAYCINVTAQALGPEVAATVDDLPKAAAALRAELVTLTARWMKEVEDHEATEAELAQARAAAMEDRVRDKDITELERVAFLQGRAAAIEEAAKARLDMLRIVDSYASPNHDDWFFEMRKKLAASRPVSEREGGEA